MCAKSTLLLDASPVSGATRDDQADGPEASCEVLYTHTGDISHVMQVLVDISTPAEVFDRVDAAVGAHTGLHPGEFTGGRLVCARDAGEPLKYALCIFYEFCHNGTSHKRLS